MAQRIDGVSERGKIRLRLPRRGAFYLLIIAICGILVFPYYWMALTSLQVPSRTYTSPPQFFLLKPAFHNYPDAFVNKPVITWLMNSLIVATATMILSVVIATFAGYSISRFRYRGRTFVGILILTSQMFPGTLIVVPYYILMQKIHLLDTLQGLTLTHISFAVPLCVWILKGFFDSVPREIEEAALMDGCSHLKVLLRIVLPVSFPAIISTALFSFMLSWHEFLFSRTLLNSPSKWTVPAGIASFVGEYQTNWNQVMAGAVVLTAPPVILFLLLNRYLVSGMTSGAVKG